MTELARIAAALALVERLARELAMQMETGEALLAEAVQVELAELRSSKRVLGLMRIRAVVAVAAVALAEELADLSLRSETLLS